MNRFFTYINLHSHRADTVARGTRDLKFSDTSRHSTADTGNRYERSHMSLNRKPIIVSIVALVGIASIQWFVLPMDLGLIYLTPILQLVLFCVGAISLLFLTKLRLKLICMALYLMIAFGACGLNNFDYNTKRYLSDREQKFLQIIDVISNYPCLNGVRIVSGQNSISIDDTSCAISQNDKALIDQLMNSTGHFELYIESKYIYFTSSRVRDKSRGIAYARSADSILPIGFGGGLKIIEWVEIKERWYFFTTT